MEFNALNESFFKTLPDPVLFLDVDEKVIDANEAFLNLAKSK